MSVTIVSVDTPALKKAFIRQPWSIYGKDPNWVPPLLMDRHDFLNPKKNPFFEFATVQLYLAQRDGQWVGRIAAVDDPHYQKHQEQGAGAVGMFESIPDEEVSGALFEAAQSWLKDRGLKKVVGPLNLSLNHEAGLLVDGFDDPACVMMTYNPRYYEDLWTAAGYQGVKDLWAWEIDLSKELPKKVVAVSKRIEQRNNIRVRSVDMKRWDREVETIFELYNDCWIENWGFVPVTEHEFFHTAKDLKMLVSRAPELALIAEVDGRPVGFSLTLLDINQAFHPINGRLLPTGIFKLLLGLKRINRVRLILLGMREEYRGRGIDAIFYRESFDRIHALARRRGLRFRGEISWTLDDNDMVNRSIRLMGGELYKTYRVYERSLA